MSCQRYIAADAGFFGEGALWRVLAGWLSKLERRMGFAGLANYTIYGLPVLTSS